MRWIQALMVVTLTGCGAESPNGDRNSTNGGSGATGGNSTSSTGGGGGSAAASGGTSTTGGSSTSGGSNTAGGSDSSGGTTANGGSTAGAQGGTGGTPDPVDVGTPGVWVDISPLGLESALGLAAAPSDPGVVYVNAKTGWPPSDPQSGIFRSSDGGVTWDGPLGSTFLNEDGSSYGGGNPWAEGVSWTLAVDPTDPDIVYAHCSFFGPQAPWKTTDGGVTWQGLFSASDNSQMSADIYAVSVDPLNHEHVLLTFHSGWGGGDAGVAESTDGGDTWIPHAPQSGWGAGHYAFFLEEDDEGNPSSDAWILATQGDGFWRTMNAGDTWTQVAGNYFMQHGAGGMYRASTGILYMGALSHVIRSTDNGATWSDAGAPSNQDGYNTIIGDGTHLYAQSANTGNNTTGPQTFFTSLETDGTSWTAFNDQTFADGPGWMAVDKVSGIVYASLWDHGLWRLKAADE